MNKGKEEGSEREKRKKGMGIEAGQSSGPTTCFSMSRKSYSFLDESLQEEMVGKTL